MTTKTEFIRDIERGLLPAHADCVRAGGSDDDYSACMQKHFDRLWEKYGASLCRLALDASPGVAATVAPADEQQEMRKRFEDYHFGPHYPDAHKGRIPSGMYNRQREQLAWNQWIASWTGAVAFNAAQSVPAAPQVAADPLQGAADWLREAIPGCTAIELQRNLLIGHNRARRLFDRAAAPVVDGGAAPAGNWVCAGDVGRLTRALDVALNGEEGAADQASLCDVVAQVLRERSLKGAPLLAPAPVDGGAAGVRDYPPMPQADSWVGFSEMFGKDKMRAYVDADRSARAGAPSDGETTS